ncbi:type IV secretion system protein [Lysobacter sp. K5869]|uniref:type IV secretion system protein n=1 Tax=Lysobacter sp. K5869 TaxID=2820808 RepID=UPI001C062829|nr:type IV secretion system protein [Lysobacter sp. K5869]QWP75705.1 type IV secretion system protein [Lysobacter sp. K5869]
MQLPTEFYDWLNPQAQGVGDYLYFKLVNLYFDQKIDKFGLALMRRTMAWASQIALVLATLWIMLAGYRIVTGQSREPMMALVTNAARVTFILALATTMSFGGAGLHRFFTKDLDHEVHALFTDDSSSSADAIDKNLAYMQVAMSAIDAVQIPEDNLELQRKKERALLFAGVGTASPPMVAGAMLLLYKFTLALFIGLGPLFILCLMFDQTKDLFRKWLMYGIGTFVLDVDAQRGGVDGAGVDGESGGRAVGGESGRDSGHGRRGAWRAGHAAGRDRAADDDHHRDGAAGGGDVLSGDGGEFQL